MSWTLVIWLMSAGVCITLAAVHLLLWLRDRNAQASLAFSVWTTAVAISALLELAMMHAPTREKYAVLLGATAFPFAVTAIAYIAFIRLYLQAGRRWLMWSVFGIVALELLVKITVLPTHPFVEITGLQKISFWGDTLVAPVGVKSPWLWITGLLIISELAFIGNAAVEAWRGHKHRQVKIVAVAICCSTAFSVAIAALVMLAELPPPIIVILPSMFMILVMAYGLGSDLIKASQLSQNLRASQERIRLAASAADLGMWEWDFGRDSFWINETSRRRLGVGESERLTFNRFLESVHPDDREPTRQNMNQTLEGGRNFDWEYRLLTPDGKTRLISARGQVERNVSGKPLLVRGVSTDITDRKQAEKALEENEKRLKEAQRIAHIGSWELDLLTNTLTWSDEIFRIFEIDKDHFGASYEFFLSTVHPEDREAVDIAYRQSLETHKPYVITHRLLMPDGGVKYVKEQCETFYSPAGKPLRSLGTVQDVTQEKQAEIERIRLRNDLAHAQRVSTMGHISSALAHELNQPLGAILNNASAAQILGSKPEGENTELGEIIADIISDARRAGQVVRKIRGIVKKTEVKFEQLNVNVLIEEVVLLYRNAFNLEKISGSLDLQPDISPIRGDRIHLQQVLMNLINNASEAMRESSSKTLKIRSTLQTPDLIIVSVIDSGTGIDEAKKEKVFDQFFSTKKDGLGLGLGICRSIIEEHGGQIWVENNPAGGATFSFSLKAYRGDSG